jgi:hypothetical protein
MQKDGQQLIGGAALQRPLFASAAARRSRLSSRTHKSRRTHASPAAICRRLKPRRVAAGAAHQKEKKPVDERVTKSYPSSTASDVEISVSRARMSSAFSLKFHSFISIYLINKF